jgi:carbon monoxide dehydrogenase subunit G
MILDGSFTVAAPRDKVWRSIRDPEVVAVCVPGCSGVEVASPTSYRAKIAISLGPMSANFDLVVDITGETPPERISMLTRGAEGSRASMLNAVSVVTLKETDGMHTDVHYTSDVSITGRFGKFGFGVIRKKADQLAKEFTKKFSDALQAADAS